MAARRQKDGKRAAPGPVAKRPGKVGFSENSQCSFIVWRGRFENPTMQREPSAPRNPKYKIASDVAPIGPCLVLDIVSWKLSRDRIISIMLWTAVF